METHVLVIGAGISGLTAARELARAGFRVKVVEARSRAGGRIFTIHPKDSSLRVELGAEFFHGRHPDLWRMAQDARLLLCEIDGEHRYANDGKLQTGDNIWQKTEQILSRMKRNGSDRSFAQFVREEVNDPKDYEATAWATAYVEGFNGADSHCVSEQWLVKDEDAAEEIDSDRQFWVVNGFGTLVDWLVSELSALSVEVLYETVADTINWRKNSVVVQTGNAKARTLEANCALITLPLGVLQAAPGEQGALRFVPEVAEHRQAATQLAMGSAWRITLHCREPFWSGALPSAGGAGIPDLSFLHALNAPVPTWWTPYPLNAPLITGWAGGPKALDILRRPESERVEAALDTLSAATGLDRRTIDDQVIHAYAHDWQHDPFARGAYSYVPVGALPAIDVLSRPCDETLFFAGEATDTTGHSGTVHGAAATGLRAAQQIQNTLRSIANTKLLSTQ